MNPSVEIRTLTTPQELFGAAAEVVVQCANEAGAQRDIAEIDPIGAGRDSQVGSACGDLFSLDQDHATCLDPIRFAVEDSRSFESDSHFDIDLTYTTLQQRRQRSPRD